MFLGLADYVKEAEHPFPVGPLDIFRLSRHKVHLMYPAIIGSNEWIFLLGREIINSENFKSIELHITSPQGKLVGKVTEFYPYEISLDKKGIRTHNTPQITIVDNEFSYMIHFKFESAIAEEPGEYSILLKLNNKFINIGKATFHYQPSPPFTPDQIVAIQSDPNSAKAVGIALGCKYCTSKLKVYSALQRQPYMEKDGHIWQYDLGDRFECECGKTSYSLKYIKGGLHGLLLKDFSQYADGFDYVRRYAHEEMMSTINKFNSLLESEPDEKPFQEFIENNPIMLAQFGAKRIFKKPNILGKFECDFAILNSQNQLLLIEIERPSMRLFKKDLHPTANLLHAYGQVNDWLQEVAKHFYAVLDGLKLKQDEVFAIKGVVIAGKKSSDMNRALQRHLSNPPYPSIAFFTLDDLSNSLFTISRGLA